MRMTGASPTRRPSHEQNTGLLSGLACHQAHGVAQAQLSAHYEQIPAQSSSCIH